METKFVLKSKEVWLAIGVVINSLLNGFGFPSVPLTPEVIGAVGVVFFALRTWFTDSKLVWQTRK